MKALITGICGFAGSTVSRALKDVDSTIELFGLDNFSRPGSEVNRATLRNLGVAVHRADLRNASDVDELPASDWVIDASCKSECSRWC
jgi:CDP-paratose 2-epimerase